MENKLSQMLLPELKLNREKLEKRYPERDLKESAKVTRLGPSPTGFIHLGNLYGAFVDERLAAQSDGIFYLRIEDTDDKRFVDGAVDAVIDTLGYFDINFYEGVTKIGENGEYGPYYQSQRGEIYRVFAKELLDRNLAYPCFMTEDEIAQIRERQLAEKRTPGIYGEYSKYRNITFEEAEELIKKGMPYVIRLKSSGSYGEDAELITVDDAIRGKLTMPENFQDAVILKSNGIPTYHFAHVVDDHLMRTTHVVRGEEWLSTLPIHVELFEKLGFELPTYCHTAQLMKIDENGNKRKLSKRKDPELSLDYYKEVGYHKEAVKEYLLTILNSNFEEWRIANPDTDWREFEFSMSKMSTSGTLFDINKLNDVSKDVLVKISGEDLYPFLTGWATDYREDMARILQKNKEYVVNILDLDRQGKKPRKDFISAGQILDNISYFFDECFKILESMPEEVLPEDVREILERYKETYDEHDDQSQWFEKIRTIAGALGYALKPKDYKKNPDEYKGHVGHVSTVIRIALVGRSQSPDLWGIQQILGTEKVMNRIEGYLKKS